MVHREYSSWDKIPESKGKGKHKVPTERTVLQNAVPWSLLTDGSPV